MNPPLYNDGLGDLDPWKEVDPPMSEDEKRERFPRLDWNASFAKDFSEVEWLPGKFLERGQQAALVGSGKVGKSLFVHDWIWRMVTGRRFLSDERHEPLRVLYFDRENNEKDIITRMVSFGAVARELEPLDYRLFPGFSGSLDESSIAAAELLVIVEESKPDLVVFDTVSRFIGGNENDADTWLSFYRRVHSPLKALGIAALRLDHMGKDEERGSRGSSAKAQDVDHVWELTKNEEFHRPDGDFETIVTELVLRRTHTRTGLGQENFFIQRRATRERGGGPWLPGGTSHELGDPGPLKEHHDIVQAAVDALMAAGAPSGLGREKLRAWASANGIQLPGKNATLADIATSLKAARAA